MALLTVAALIAILAVLRADDDVLMDPAAPDARAAVEAAQAIVKGELVDVRRDRDDAHKWEVTLRAGEDDYEVELEPVTLALLRIDYK